MSVIVKVDPENLTDISSKMKALAEDYDEACQKFKRYTSGLKGVWKDGQDISSFISSLSNKYASFSSSGNLLSNNSENLAKISENYSETDKTTF